MSPVVQDARLRILAARIVAQQRWPYASSVLYSLKPVEVSHEELSTMGVDSGWRLYYSPKFVLEHPVEVIATALIHECLHCLFDHMSRFAGFSSQDKNANIFNICGDAHINKVIDDDGMPWGEFDPVRFDSLKKYEVSSSKSTEANHELIQKFLRENQEEFDQNQDCGSAASGGNRDYELEPDDAGNPATGEDSKDIIRDAVALDVEKHAKGQGKVPGELARWAESRTRPSVDWRKRLATGVRGSLAKTNGLRDYSYKRPSRKQDAISSYDASIVLPSLSPSGNPSVGFLVDTSGSVSQEELSLFANELLGVLNAIGFGGKISVIGCDTRPSDVFFVKKAKDIPNLPLKGGGGTDLRPGLEKMRDEPRPSITVIATDGLTPWHELAPDPNSDYIGLITEESAISRVPRWITPILIEGDTVD